MLPGKVYLETSLLRGLPFDLERADFLVFRELCDRYGVPLATTRLCVDELIEHRRADLRKWTAAIEAPPPWLSAHVGSPVAVQWSKSKDDVLGEVASAVVRVLGSQGIEIIENAKIDPDKLLEMAVKKVPPFKDKGRGYRDAVILLTILDHERNRQDVRGCLIVASDGDFENPRELPEARGLGIEVVRSAQEARENLEQRMEDLVKAHLKLRGQKLEDFLLTRRSQIQQFIRQHAPSPGYSLADAPGVGLLEVVETINGDTIELGGIEKPFAGFLPAGVEEGWANLSFVAKVKARGTVRPLTAPLPLPTSTGMDTAGQATERLIEPLATIDGSVLMREFPSPEYRDLKLSALRWGSQGGLSSLGVFRSLFEGR